MRKAVYFVAIVIVLLSCLATGCGSKARPQLLSASGTTCTVRNNGPAGEVKVTFYQVPGVSLGQRPPLCKQWVVFPLAEGEEITLRFSVITDSSKVGRGCYYVSGLPPGTKGGSKEEHYTIITSGGGPGQTIMDPSAKILKEFQSPYCYHSGSSSGYALGFRVQ